MTMTPLAEAWLQRVEELARDVPDLERRELVEDLRAHLNEALAGHESDPDRVAGVLARMGDPVDIVAAASADDDPSGTVPPGPRTLTGAESATLVGLMASGLLLPLWPLAVLAWLVGVILLVGRTRWQGRSVVVGLALPFGWSLPWAAVGLFVVPVASCTVSGGVERCDGPPVWVGYLLLAGVVALLGGTVWATRWFVRQVRTV